MDNDEKVLGEPEAMAEGEAAEEQQTVQDVQPGRERSARSGSFICRRACRSSGSPRHSPR